MKSTGESGIIHWIVIIIGIILILFLVGFFRSEQSFSGFNYKSILRLPCGITVNSPKQNDTLHFPVQIDGYANGCGWEVAQGSAGTVQIFDGHGSAMTAAVMLTSDSTSAPYAFQASVPLSLPPQTDTGSVIFKSTTGLIYAIPVGL